MRCLKGRYFLRIKSSPIKIKKRGFEILLRWNKNGKIIKPAIFLPRV